jgi:thiol-disulfide isomerase/thioredoxin
MMKWPCLFLCLSFSMSVFADKLEFFYAPDCPKCEHANAALVDYQGKNPHLEIVGVDVTQNKENLARLRYLGLKERLPSLDLPAFYYQSTMKAGMEGPQSVIAWIEETKKNTKEVGVFNFFGMDISYEKTGASLFSILLAVKDFFFSLWGVVIIACSLALALIQKRFDSMIGILAFSSGAIFSSILWTFPAARVWFDQVAMVDFFLGIALALLSLGMVIKSKKYSLSGWSELGLFSLGLVLQRIISFFSGFELLRLQDVLLEAGAGIGHQAAMNIVYGLVQLFLAGIVIVIASKIKKNS